MAGGGRKPVDVGTFAGRLKAARIGSSYSAEEIAAHLGLASAQSIYDYESPKKAASPSPVQLGKMAAFLGRSLDWLIYGEEAETEFIAELRAREPVLSPRSKHAILRVAQTMADEDAESQQADRKHEALIQELLGELQSERSAELLRALDASLRERAAAAPLEEEPPLQAPTPTRARA